MPKNYSIANVEIVHQQNDDPKTSETDRDQIMEMLETNITKLNEISSEFSHIEELLRQDKHQHLRLISDMLYSDYHIEDVDLLTGLREIFDAAPFYILLVDESHRIIMANSATRKDLGLEPEQIIGKYCPKVIHGLDHPFEGCPLEQAMEEGHGVESEFCDQASGTWMQSVAYPTNLRTKDGKAIYLHMVHDITQKRLTIETMRETNQTLQTLIQSSPLAIIVLDVDGNVMIWNSAAERTFGLGEHDVLFHPCPSVLKGNDEAGSICGRILKREPFAGMEVSSQTKDGTRIDISVSSAPLYDGASEIRGTLLIVEDITERKCSESKLRESFERLQKTVDGTVLALASVSEKRDPYTAGHQQRVADLAFAIAIEMDLPREQIEGIRVAGMLHDIGKLSVPAEILSKPSRLTEAEFSMIKCHPQHGYDILSAIDFPWPIAQIVVQHHERIDGSGYPAGLKGDNMLLESRILAVADVVEAMASHRPYRPSRGIEEALKEISEGKGTRYDAEVVGVCLGLLTEKGYGFE